ncbi:GNAT family N-acetyltransferase [Roseateles sp. SL47]|jgi:[ribosomal protein S5]-alanine N-acetyltransferase|uniref:GNAT family N-acetyltransferase n=1 Tax=Roseateles sp. SL47 TaxID=2995138 RepID=UPI00226FD558|nr:GNAT family N-acetyltransferase [Roseateles sp. SL47]WAC75083.1 GNAT family N-acetyltransferase [Roseateles sp. SL47]
MTAGLSIQPLSEGDVEELRQFEFLNRTFFESRINARPPKFYEAGGVEAAVAEALREVAEDRGYQYLIRNAAGRLVGRINLSHVRRQHFHSCELGYRIGESENGKGYASAAVKLMLAQAFGPLGLMRVEARARADNMGSVRVLQRNGFTQFGRSQRSFEIGGEWFDVLCFEVHALN